MITEDFDDETLDRAMLVVEWCPICRKRGEHRPGMTACVGCSDAIDEAFPPSPETLAALVEPTEKGAAALRRFGIGVDEVVEVDPDDGGVRCRYEVAGSDGGVVDVVATAAEGATFTARETVERVEDIRPGQNRVRVRIEGGYRGTAFVYEDADGCEGSQFIYGEAPGLVDLAENPEALSRYWWTGGSFGCDCNRSTFLPESFGHDESCGTEIVIDRIVPLMPDAPDAWTIVLTGAGESSHGRTVVDMTAEDWLDVVAAGKGLRSTMDQLENSAVARLRDVFSHSLIEYHDTGPGTVEHYERIAAQSSHEEAQRMARTRAAAADLVEALSVRYTGGCGVEHALLIEELDRYPAHGEALGRDSLRSWMSAYRRELLERYSDALRDGKPCRDLEREIRGSDYEPLSRAELQRLKRKMSDLLRRAQ